MPATVEINDAVFCSDQLKEVCDDCEVDQREENDAFYGFDPNDRDAIEPLEARQNHDGAYVCKKQDNSACNQCFGWKKQITRLRMEAKKAGRK